MRAEKNFLPGSYLRDSITGRLLIVTSTSVTHNRGRVTGYEIQVDLINNTPNEQPIRPQSIKLEPGIFRMLGCRARDLTDALYLNGPTPLSSMAFIPTFPGVYAVHIQTPEGIKIERVQYVDEVQSLYYFFFKTPLNFVE